MSQPTSRPQSNAAVQEVWALVVVGALAAGVTPAHPTGVAFIDVIERAALGGVVVWFAARSRPWTWLVLAGTAAALAGSWGWLLVAVVALGLAIPAVVRSADPDPRLGALVGVLCMQVLLHAATVGRFGFTALVTATVTVMLLVSGYRAAAESSRRRIRIAGGALLGFVLLATVAFAATSWRFHSPMERGLAYAQGGVTSAEKGSQGPATLQLLAAHIEFSRAHDIQTSPFAKLARGVPILSQHARLLETASSSGRNLAESALSGVAAAPYEDLRTTNGTFDLDLLASMHEPIASTVSTTRHTIERIDAADSPWLLGSVRDRITHYRGELAEAIPRAEAALEALDMAPSLLGADRPKRYLVLFANPAESRGLGGFIGAWAELEADGGRVRLRRHGHIDELNDASDWRTRRISGPAEYLERYSRLQPERYLQNVSASPDFPTVATVTAELYDQAMDTRLDGVLYVDPIALGALLELTGPVVPEGSWHRIDATSAADYLMHDQYLRYPGRTARRIDDLSATAEATFEALTRGELPAIHEVTGTLSPMVHQRRLLFWATDPEVESYLSSLGLTGAFPEARGGDLLSVRISNASTNKADYYLDQTTRYTVRHDPTTGATTATARVTFDNHAPSSGEPTYVLGNPDSRTGKVDGRPFGSDTVTVSLYSALRPASLSIDGVHSGIQVQRELGVWVGSQTVTVPPGGQVTLEFTLAGDLGAGHDYRLTVAPQPSARTRHTTVVVKQPDSTVTRTFGDDRVHHLVAPDGVRASP